MMKKTLCGSLLMLCALAAWNGPVAHAQQRAAVLPFEVRNNAVSPDDALVFYGDFSNRFTRVGQESGLFSVVPRGDVERIFRQESAFQLSDLSDEQKTAELGRVLNADWIISGVISRTGSHIVFIVSIYTYTFPGFTDLDGSQVYAASIDELINKIPELTEDIHASMTGIPPGPAQSVPASPRMEGFVLVAGGTFTMGSPSNEAKRESDEGPQHQVTVKSFYIGQHEVTQREWQEIMGNNPSYFRGDNLPVEQVSWYEVIRYCNRRSVREGLTPAYRGFGDAISCDWNANGYRLPTEAEWEYAAKGGKKNFLTYLYAGSNSVDTVGWYRGNSGGTTHPVGTKAANDLGLYDMSGNVWEWCWDWKADYSSGAQTDPRGLVSGSNRVIRGGSWLNGARNLRSSIRSSLTPSYRIVNLGFRLVRSAP